MDDRFSRTELLIGNSGMQKLHNSRVAVFGLGGVGGYVVEALVRSGLGAIDLIDNDTVALSNINRQIIATQSTIGKAKTEVVKNRVLEINPYIKVNTYQTFYNAEKSHLFDFSAYNYIVDAIDTVSAKLALIEEAKKVQVPIICAMGAGNKLDPTIFEVADISNTSVCPLARVMRTELKKRNITKGIKVVYSKEPPLKTDLKDATTNKNIPASIAFVPSVAGLIIAGEVIKDIIS